MSKITELIGVTPLTEIQHLNTNPKVKVYAKLEGNNPAGSVKDRPAYYMIQNAITRGDIQKDTKIIEATSGNTGIALAMISGLFGLSIELVMPKSATAERVRTMQAYGAEVTLLDDIEVCRDYAGEKGRQEGYYQINQFANPDNPLAHFETTGPEIWKATQGKITHFVSAMGTTGTIMGTSKFLKLQNENVQIIGCQPKEGSRIPGIRKWPEAYLPKFYEPSRVDQLVGVSAEEATHTARALAKKEGVFAGMSTGGAATVALNLAKTLTEGVVVFIACDRGDRYLSSALYNLEDSF